jgi:hypothetical protein
MILLWTWASGTGKRIFRPTNILAALVLTLAPFTFSQTITTADSAGVVSDTSGAVVPGAKVTIKSLESGETRAELTTARRRIPLPAHEARRLRSLGRSPKG